MSSPTRGATEPAGSWSRSPAASFMVRMLAHALPVLAAWLAIKVASQWFYEPEGWSGVAAWVAQAILVAVVVSRWTDVLSRRLLALATLLNMSLVFPDHAPSKIGVALRAGSVKKLRSRLDAVAGNAPDTDTGTAAERALDLVAALSLHDRRTRGHTERVRALADVIAEQLDVDESERLLLAWGVLLHDVGKLTVPASILNKTEQLTDAEWAILRDHPEASRRMLEPLAGWLGPWVRAAGEHHERWDGHGYPAGLAKTEISLAGRITAVADAYDVITSKRSYKEPMSAEAARNEIVRCAGTQFDPAVVRAFLNAGLGRRRTAGLFAWLFEAPSVGQVGSSIGAAAATVTAAGAVLVSGLTGSGPPDIQTPSVLAEVTSTSSVPLSTAPTTTSTHTQVRNDLRPATGSTDAPAPTSTSGTGELAAPGTTTSAPPSPTPTWGPITTTPPGDGFGAPGSATTLVVTAVTTTAPPAAGGSGSLPPTTIAATTPAITASPATTTPPTTPATSPQTTTARPTTTTSATTTTSTTTAPGKLLVALTNPGTGDTESSPQLPLTTGAVDVGPLPNYDTDRDGDAGLLLKKDGAGLATNDPTKFQDWTLTTSSTTTLEGRATLSIDVAAKDLDGDEQIGITAGLYVCAPTCSRIGSANWSATSWEDRYRTATLDLGTITQVLAPGDTLRLRIVAPDSLAETDLFLAYDTTTHPGQLAIG